MKDLSICPSVNSHWILETATCLVTKHCIRKGNNEFFKIMSQKVSRYSYQKLETQLHVYTHACKCSRAVTHTHRADQEDPLYFELCICMLHPCGICQGWHRVKKSGGAMSVTHYQVFNLIIIVRLSKHTTHTKTIAVCVFKENSNCLLWSGITLVITTLTLYAKA